VLKAGVNKIMSPLPFGAGFFVFGKILKIYIGEEKTNE